MNLSAYVVRERVAPPVAFAITWLASFLCFVRGFAPTGEFDGRFSSDSAIPIMMANAPQLTLYELYYYGQDRFGAFAPALGWLVQIVLQTPWTASDVFGVNALILSFGVVTLCVAAFRDTPYPLAPFVAAVVACVVLCLAGSIGSTILSIAHPYGTGVGLACVAMAFLTRPSSDLRACTALAGASFLACWVTPASLPILAFAWVPLAVREFSRHSFRGPLLHGTMIVAGFGVERMLHRTYLRHVESAYAWELAHLRFRVETNMSIEVAELPQSVGFMISALSNSLSTGEWVVVAAAVIAPIILCWRGTTLGVAHIATETPILAALACVAAACGNLVGVSLPAWTRLNEYPFRYLVPTVAFLIVAANITVVYGICLIARPFGAFGRAPQIIAVLAAGCGLYVAIPRPHVGVFNELERTARTLTEHDTSVVVFGDYWGTYIWQGLNHDVLAVPLERQVTRTPNTLRDLRNQRIAFYCTELTEPPTTLVQFQTSWSRTARLPLESPLCRLYEYSRIN